MGADKEFGPPQEVHDRLVGVQADVVNTVEVPCDPRDPDFARWFDVGEGMQPIRQNNRVKFLIDGSDSFLAMASAIGTADSANHYIYMMNWYADLDVDLAPASPPKSAGAVSNKLMDLLTNAVAKGVQVRALFWDQVWTQNSSSVDRINRLDNANQPGANGGAILDTNTLNFSFFTSAGPAHCFGSHHQKVLIVRGGSGLITFCGGVDFNLDRVQSVSRQPGSPMHDVHCQIQGPAAFDLLKIFLQRWTDNLVSTWVENNLNKGPLRGVAEPVPGNFGEQYVQIGRTYGNGSRHGGITNINGYPYYTFAKNGERTAERLIFHAIEQATQFIYVEDQYLASPEASNKLLAQLPKIQKLIILIPHPSLSDHPKIWAFNKMFIDNFKGDPKVTVCYKKRPGAARTPKSIPATTSGVYIHAKMWIMDDKFAIIGSANCGQRSYTCDSEVVAGIYDESKDTPCTVHFAHSLRIELWAQHLNMKPAQVMDPIGSSRYWYPPPPGNAVNWFDPDALGIAVFDQNADTDSKLKASNYGLPEEAEPFGG